MFLTCLRFLSVYVGLLLLLTTAGCRAACCKYFEKKENQKGRRQTLTVTLSVAECKIRCCSIEKCLGFDFNKNKDECRIHSDTFLFIPDINFDHYVRSMCSTTAPPTTEEVTIRQQTTHMHPMPKKSQVNHPVAIVCMRNCRGRPNVHEAIALKITSSLQPIVSTEWSVNPAINWKRDTGSGNSRQFLSIYENVLQPGTKYNVTATVQIRQGTKRMRTFKISKPLHMATPPTLGTCSVTPRKGVFLQDKFAVNCSGFIDLTPPLTYMFYLDPREYKTSPHGLLMYVSVGKPFLPPMMLPTKHQHNYTATIRMVVVDGLAASTFLDVKFQLLRFGNKGTELRKMGELLTSLGEGDIFDAMSLAQSALATLRNASAETKELAPKWLNTITYFLTGIKDIYATTVLLKANVLKEITATSFNSTTNARVAAAGLLEEMAKNLQSFQKDDNDTWDSPESKPVHIKEAAKAIYEGCLRMMDTETQNVTPENMQSVKKLSRQLLRTIDLIVSTIINLMVPGSRTTVIKVGDDVILLKKGLAYLIGRQTFSFPPIPGDGRGVSLTLTKAAAEDDESGMNFGMAVHRMTRNPYVWSTSSKHLMRGVVFINHYQSLGSSRQTKELKRNITIAFPLSTEDEANGTAIVHVSYVKNRDEVFEDDLSIAALPVLSNKRYHIKMFVTAKVTLVLVVKAYTKPDCWDFYGGDRISKNATIFVVDFARKALPRKLQTKTAPGLEHVIVDVNATTVTLIGTLHSKEERVMLYFGLMPAAYDTILCKRCSGNSINPCGFCSGKMGTPAETEHDVKVTVVRYVADCVFWNSQEEKWSNEGCEVLSLPTLPSTWVASMNSISENDAYALRIVASWEKMPSRLFSLSQNTSTVNVGSQRRSSMTA